MNQYTINVAINGRHYCRIELPDTREQEAVPKAKTIAKAFGAAFECTLQCWNNTGHNINISNNS